jgi:hypothetical protein
VQYHILYIELMNKLGVHCGQGEDCVNSCWLDHWAKGLIIVDIRALGEPSKDLVSPVSFQCAIRVELVLEDPFFGDDVGASGLRNEIPGLVGDQYIKFFFHCTTPIRISERAPN